MPGGRIIATYLPEQAISTFGMKVVHFFSREDAGAFMGMRVKK